MWRHASGRKFVAGVAVASALLISGAANACSCRTPTLALSVADADIVLVVKVTAFKPLDHVTLLPGEVLKGSMDKAFTVPTGQSDCDYFLPPIHPTAGDRFLLFLRQSEGRLTASRCLPSGRVADKAAELRALRTQFPPRARPRAALAPKSGTSPARTRPFHAHLQPFMPEKRLHQRSAATSLDHFHA